MSPVEKGVEMFLGIGDGKPDGASHISHGNEWPRCLGVDHGGLPNRTFDRQERGRKIMDQARARLPVCEFE